MPSFVLTSDSPGPFCQGPVVFTCNATNIAVVLHWVMDDVRISSYTFNPMDTYPLNLTVTSSLPAWIQVTSASFNVYTINVVSTLSISDVSVLNGSSLHCEDQLFVESNSTDVNVIAQGTCGSNNKNNYLYICTFL